MAVVGIITDGAVDVAIITVGDVATDVGFKSQVKVVGRPLGGP